LLHVEGLFPLNINVILNIYTTTSVLKVEGDIVAWITSIGRAVMILKLLYLT